MECGARRGGEADFSSAFQSRVTSAYAHDHIRIMCDLKAEMNLRTPKTLCVGGASPSAAHSKDALRRGSKPFGGALQRRFASGGDALAPARLRLQLPTGVAAPRGGSALRTDRSKTLRFLERSRAPPGGTAALRPAFAGLTFRFAPAPRLRGPAQSDQRSSRAGLRPATCRCGRRCAAILFNFYFLREATARFIPSAAPSITFASTQNASRT